MPSQPHFSTYFLKSREFDDKVFLHQDEGLAPSPTCRYRGKVVFHDSGDAVDRFDNVAVAPALRWNTEGSFMQTESSLARLIKRRTGARIATWLPESSESCRSGPYAMRWLYF
jgi:hypothetical protein